MENGKLNIYNKSIFPILVLFGDTIVEEKFLNRIIARYYSENSENKEETRIIWGLAKTEKGKSNVYCAIHEYPEDNEGFFEISGEDIIDCIQYPKKNIPEDCCYLYTTGMMIISKTAWDNICKLMDRIHRPSPRGLFTFENILKQALMFRNIPEIMDMGIKIVGIVAPEGQWYEATYPWEMLDLNKTKISDLVKDTVWAGGKGESILIREEAEWTKEKEEEIGEKTILVQSDVKFTMSNGARIKGPCILGKKND